MRRLRVEALAASLAGAFLACNSPSKTPTTCVIAGATYSTGAPNPTNPCQSCQPAQVTGAWSDAPLGTTCGTGGMLVCSGGLCLSGCVIGGTFYAADSANPKNACQTCQPTASTVAFSPLTGVVSGACPSGDLCETGACTPACSIGGTIYPDKAINPKNQCQGCQAAQSLVGWTDLAAGTTCADGGAICSAGNCQSGCEVGGVFFPAAATSPHDVCQTCQPALATNAFSPFTGIAPGGCDGGAYCVLGACSDACAIGGASVAAGAPNPGNACQSCQPSANLTGWTDLPTGASCSSGDAGNAVCAQGVCVSGCVVAGVFYNPGVPDPADGCQTCQPAVSATAFSPFTGVPPGGCSGGQACSAGVCGPGCFIQGAVVPSRAYKPNDTGFCCGPLTDPSNWIQSFARGATFAGGSGQGTGTQLITTADFNKDGLPDVALLNPGDSTVSVFLNQGGGTFGVQATFAIGDNAQSLIGGDLNGDGKADLVVVDNDGAALGILLSFGFADGGQGFGIESQLPYNGMSFGASTIRIQDLNGDQEPDIVAANGSFSDSISVYLNKGAGVFAAQVTYNPALNWVSQVVVADFNSDGFPDIASGGEDANAGVDRFAILFNDKAGKFTVEHDFTATEYPGSIGTADFNVDGVPDLAATATSDTNTYLGIGDGGLVNGGSSSLSSGSTLVPGDLNGDGKPDLVVTDYSGDLNFLIGLGTGSFQPASTIQAREGTSFVVADFNADGAPDIAIVDPNGKSWTVWLNACP